MRNKFQTIVSFLKHPFVLIIAGSVIFLAFDKMKAYPGSTEVHVNKTGRSVELVNGKYKVDTMFIRNDISKKQMIGFIEKQILDRKKSIHDIPSFIWSFLDSISYDRKFDIVDPGEEWKQGITDYGHVKFKKVYDRVKQDSVSVLYGDGAVLPNKQMVYVGMNENVLLMSYLTGGLGPSPNIIMVKYKNGMITDFWYGSIWGDGSLESKAEILKSLKSKRQNGC